MKLKVVLIALFLSLATIGSSCVNEGVLVSVNLNPIIGRYKLGTSTSFGGVIVVKLDSLITSEYKNRIRQGRVYDLKVKVEGEYTGSVSGFAAIGIGTDSLKQILRFPGSGTVRWSAFYAPQSLLSNSPYLSPQHDGINILLHALTTTPLPEIKVAAIGNLSVAPVPADLFVTIELYLQADAELH